MTQASDIEALNGRRRTVVRAVMHALGRVSAAGLVFWLTAAAPVFAQPVPTVGGAPPVQATLGEPFTFPVTFDNTGTTTGYGPFIDMLFPATGVDGAGAATDDGITFVSASYLGVPVTSQTITLDVNGRATHPFAVLPDGTPLIVTGPPGDQLVVLTLPFGSVTVAQPAATIQITATTSTLADLDAPLQLFARGSFQFGADPLANPMTDPLILGPVVSGPVSPVLWRLTKTYLGPEGETTTGPNFPRQYRIAVDVAAGQTIANLDLTDVLPATLQFVSVDATSGPATDIATPSTATPGGTLTRRFASITGTASTQDASMTFTYYAVGLDGATPVLDPVTGDDATAVDDARSAATWTPVDTRDPAVPVTNDATADDHTLALKSLATQKSVSVVVDGGAPGPTAGDTLEYVVNVQLSDFFAVQGLVVTDVISDGQRQDPSFVPTLAITEHSGGTSPAAPMNPLSFEFVVDGTTGATNTTFLLGPEQVLRGLDIKLLGGCVPAGGTGGSFPSCTTFNGGPTSVRLVYRTIIQEQFSNPPSGADPSVSHGDTLSNAVGVSADVLSTADAITTTGSSDDDTSDASVTVPAGNFTKTVYAVNGSTAVPSPVRLGPGDTITYRLRYALPSTDVDALGIADYLPLPILTATELTGPFAATVSATPPAAGSAKFGPDDTAFAISGQIPAMTTDATANSVTFTFPAFSDPANRSSLIDILFTVTATDLPFADGLILSNVAQSQEGTTDGEIISSDAIGQITLNEPFLRLKKGVVATDQPAAAFLPPTVGPVAFTPPGSAGNRFTGTISSGALAATPIDSNLAGVDASDLVTFAIVVENTGAGPDGAFDVLIQDTLPAPLTIPAGGLNLRVTNGAGVVLPFTDLGGGIFGSGIRLDDGAVGSLGSFTPAAGTNIAVITYDLQLPALAQANQVIVNTATLANFAGVEGGPDFTAENPTDDAEIRTATTTVLAKILIGTSQAHTSGTNLAIGELITVRLTVTVPQGTTLPFTLTDTGDQGLALVSLDAISASPGLTSSQGSFASILAAADIQNVGGGPVNDARRFILDFGSVVNSNADPGTLETITVDYTAVALNSPGNDRGKTLSNNAELGYSVGVRNLAENSVTLVEPALQVTKSAIPTIADQGDTVRFLVTVSHSPVSNADAFDLAITDVLPAGLTFVSATFTGGVTPSSFVPGGGGGFTATWAGFPLGSASTFELVATVNAGVTSGVTLNNTATLTYSSLPGSPGVQSPLNTLSVERTGNPADVGGTQNDYLATGTAGVRVRPAGVQKMLDGTNQPTTTGNSVAIGEILTYSVTITVPEAMSVGATLVDTLDPGLAFVGFDSLDVSNPIAVTTSVPGGFPAVLAAAAVSNPTPSNPVTAGSRVTFTFGTVTNTDINNAVAETITLTYRVVVVNAGTNLSGGQRNNSARWQAGTAVTTASAANAPIVEPALQLNKSATPAAADAGDPVLFTMTVGNLGVSNANAHDVVLVDPIPAGVTVTSGPTAALGNIPTTLTLGGGVITATWANFGLGTTSTITFIGTVDPGVAPGTVVTNSAALTWTGLPGAIAAPQSTFNGLSVERTGDMAAVGTTANTYATTAAATVTIHASSLAGRVYVDANGDGLFSGGEPPLAGVVITLTGTDNLGNPVLATTPTLADGTFLFALLRPGTYTVRETQPFAYADGLDAAGTAGGTVGNDVITAITLPTGASTTATGYLFGERPGADLQVVKTDTPDPVAPGGTLTYTMVVTNNGLSDAVNVVFRDPVPSGTTFVAVAAPGMTCTAPAAGARGDVQCTAPLLAVGASVTVTLTLQVDPTALNGAVITNAAAVRSDTLDTQPANNTDTEPTTVAFGTVADVAIAKTDDVDPVVTGDTVIYTLTVTNNGPVPATGVTVTDTLPGSVTLVSTTASQGTCSATAPITCDLLTLAPGATATIAIEVTTTAPGVIVNSAVVSAIEPDPSPLNNMAAEPTTIADPGSTDLVITKVDAVDPVLTDAVIVYRLVAENRGPVPAATVTIADTVPANTVFESLTSPAGWTCTTPVVGAAGALSCSAPTLAVGATATFDVAVRVIAGTPPNTTVSNTTVVTSVTPEANTANNTDTEPTLIVGAGAADVAIVKTDAPDPQAAGLAVSYTFTVTNNGPTTATNITVTDPLPPGTAFVSGSPGCGAAAGAVTCAVGTLPPGGSTAVSITLSTPPFAGTLNNVATVAATETDPVPGNNSEPELTTLIAVADVAIAKAGPATATTGASVVYTVTVVNNGPSLAETVTVTDPTPAGLTFVSNTGACTTAYPCLLGAMLPGEIRTITTTFHVPSSRTAPIVNIATVSTSTFGDLLVNNVATVTTPLAFSGDVAVAKTASTLQPGVGTSFDYVITATNLGPSDVTNVVITETLPAGVTYQSNVTSAGTYNPGPAQWNIPSLPAGASATLTLTVRADAAGPLHNIATRTASDQPDANPANDVATVTPVALNVTDVAIVMTGPPDNAPPPPSVGLGLSPHAVLAGSVITYTLTVTNNGPAVALGVSVADPTPANLTFISTGGACTTPFPCALGTMAVGEVRVITATYQVGVVPNNTVIPNTATVSSTTVDTNPANNVSSVDIIVNTTADIGVTKTVTPIVAPVGTPVSYTVTATNYGPNPATGVVVTDQLPAGITYQSSSATQGTYDPVSGRWAIGSLAVGQSVTLMLNGVVQVTGPVTNLAIRTAQNEPDPNPANDSAAALINSGPYADIGVAKYVVPRNPAPGGALTFTVVVINHGPFDAPAVTVDDAVPDGAALVAAIPSVGTYSAATNRWTIGPMAVGATATLTMETTSTRPGVILNRAEVSGVGLPDPNELNDRDSALAFAGPVPPVQAANLRITKVALRPVVGIFEEAEFVITVTNDGPHAAPNVIVRDPVPAGLTFTDAQWSQGTIDVATSSWLIGALQPSQSATLHLTALVTTAGTVVNTAVITGGGVFEVDLSDNIDSAAVITPEPFAPQCADVELTQTYSPSTVPGGTVTFNYTATNRGPAYARDLVLTDMAMPPAGATLETLTPSAGGSCMVVMGAIKCTWPGDTLIGDGAARRLEVVYRVAPTTPPGSRIWAWFGVMTASPDCNAANDSLDGYVYVVGGAEAPVDLQVRGVAVAASGAFGPALAAPVGEPVTLRLAVTNAGAAPASGTYALILSEAGAITVTGATTTAGGLAVSGPNSGVWSTGAIAPGATVFADLVVRLNVATAVQLKVVRVEASVPDPDATNDTTAVSLDGIGPAPASGRWVATGNVDGIGGGEILTGTGLGERPQVRAFSGTGDDTGLRFNAFDPSFLGGVRLASCDIDADGTDEIVVGQGPGGSAVKVFRVAGGIVAEVISFRPYAGNFQGGVWLACADLDGDSRDDVVVGPGPGRPPEVRVFSVASTGHSLIASWMAYEELFLGGVRVATGEYSGGVVAPFQVLTTPGPGRPVVLSLWAVGGGSAVEVATGAMFAANYLGGALVDAGDIDGDGVLDIAVAPDAGTPSLLRIFSMATQQFVADVPSGAAGFTGGLRLKIGSLTGGPGWPELVTGHGGGGLPQVRVFQVGPGGALQRVELQALEVP